MNILLWAVSGVYVAVVFVVTRLVYLRLVAAFQRDLQQTEQDAQRLEQRRSALEPERMTFEERAAQLFTLYDMTREITRTFDEKAAFDVFRRKLGENLTFEDCRLIHPLSDEVKALKDAEDYYLYTFMGKNKLLGYLAVKGVPGEDMEKLNILANQFSLALRRIRLYQDVEKLATTDSLTGCHTRRYILESFEEEIQRCQLRRTSLAFLMMDVDNFKKFNDRYGHLAGDRILREIGRLVRDSIREIDVAGRYGGEEFCVVLPDTDDRGAQYVAERIRTAVEKAEIKAYDTVIRATISIGLATFPENGRTMTELLDKADHALYRAKEKGRNRVCVYGTAARG